MGQNNSVPKKDFKAKAGEALKRAGVVFTRWFFLLSLSAAAVFCVFIWYGYIWKAEWSAEKKQQYISEQAKFSFDKNGYLKIVELMKNRKDKFQNDYSFAGRAIFFPEGF